MYSSRIWQFRSLNELFITRLIVPGALHRPKGILVCSVFTQPPVPVLSPPSSSQLAGFHLPWSWQKDDDGNPKKFLCPWKCFAPDLKLFEKWLCKYAVSGFSFFSDFIYHEVGKKMMTGTQKSFCVLENASRLIWNYLKNGFASTQFLFFLFFSTSDFELCEFQLPFFILASPVFVYLHLTAVTWVLVFNIDTAERKERQTNPNEASPLFALLNRFERDS